MKVVIQQLSSKRGFTLIELMITMVVAMIILGGLLSSFLSQNKAYTYTNKRIDTTMNQEFFLRFMSEDLRGTLISLSGSPTGNPSENNAFNGVAASTSFSFWVWDETSTLSHRRALRKYVFVDDILRYDHEAFTSDETTSNLNTILEDVTFFKVFQDGTTPRAGFSDMPDALDSLSLKDEAGNTQVVQGYTVLIETAVDSSYNYGSFLNVKGEDIQATADKRKRVWRYIQEYPMAVVQ